MIQDLHKLGPLSTGATLGYSGRRRASWGIRFRTWSRYSHVGGLIYCTREMWEAAYELGMLDHLGLSPANVLGTGRWLKDGRWLTIESTMLNKQPCVFTGRKTQGVQAHSLHESVRGYKGRVWIAPLADAVRLNREDEMTLVLSCLESLGKPYDTTGAAVAGSIFWKYIAFATPGLQYCAEYWQQRLATVGLMTREGVARSTPKSVIRTQRRQGVCTKELPFILWNKAPAVRYKNNLYLIP